MKLKIFFIITLFFSKIYALDIQKHPISINGTLTNISMSFVGPLTLINLKMAIGGQYWFNEYFSLGADIGMGSEGYGKAIGVTSNSIINLKNGSMIIDPGLTITAALKQIKNLTFYFPLRIGTPIISDYPMGISLGTGIGMLVALNEYVALDINTIATVTTNFSFNYLATILSIGSIGVKIFI